MFILVVFRLSDAVYICMCLINYILKNMIDLYQCIFIAELLEKTHYLYALTLQNQF